MNRTITAALAGLALTACTPLQIATYRAEIGPLTTHDETTLLDLPDAPMHTSDGRQINTNGTITERPTGRCAQWYTTARAAGITAGQWPTIDAIMWRESRCTPNAYNPSGASGLMQIMPMWADDCGGTRSALFDPAFNLRCAVHILHTQGWQAWAT